MLIIVEKKNEIDLSRNDGFLGDGLSSLSFCARQKARCDLLDLPVLFASSEMSTFYGEGQTHAHACPKHGIPCSRKASPWWWHEVICGDKNR
jgi:hypothetical protein